MVLKCACLVVVAATATCGCVGYPRESGVEGYLPLGLDVGYADADLDAVLLDIEGKVGQVAGTHVVLFDDQTMMHAHDRWLTLPQRVISLHELLSLVAKRFDLEVSIRADRIVLTPGAGAPPRLTAPTASSIEGMFPVDCSLSVVAMDPLFRVQSGYTNSVVLPCGSAAVALRAFFHELRLVHSARHSELLKAGTRLASSEGLSFYASGTNTVSILADVIVLPNLDCFVATRMDYRHPIDVFSRAVSLLSSIVEDTRDP